MADERTGTGKPRTVELDGDICIGSRSCVRLAPSAFGFDDEYQVAEVADPDAVDGERLALAERSCPTGAIFVEWD